MVLHILCVLPSYVIRMGFDVGVAAAVVRDNHVLLVQEARGTYKGRWGLPKGYVDPGESIENAVLRELKEETGLDGVVEGFIGFRSTQKPLTMWACSCVTLSLSNPIPCSSRKKKSNKRNLLGKKCFHNSNGFLLRFGLLLKLLCLGRNFLSSISPRNHNDHIMLFLVTQEPRFQRRSAHD